VQVRDPVHRQPRQVTHHDPALSGDRDRQGPDRGRLVHDHQHAPVLAQVRKDAPKTGLVVG